MTCLPYESHGEGKQGRKDEFDTYDCLETDRNPTEISRDLESIGKMVGSLYRI
jgi:hypothetical protein